MYLIAGACLLIGIIFGRCFKVYVLAPTCAVVFFASILIACFEAQSLPWAAFHAAVRLTLLQLGYVCGLVVPGLIVAILNRGHSEPMAQGYVRRRAIIHRER